jgi:formylglycine-generating enzyme required for sulfatase activity
MKLIATISGLLFLLFSCDNEKTQPIRMVSVPKLEFISEKTRENDASQKVQVSLESFYISDEITNKEYREFTDWVKNNPDKVLSRTKDIIGSTNELGRTRVWHVPVIISMSDLLPNVIDSSALYKLDKKYKNYFTDEKYDDYPVVGVSKNNAEYFCYWKTNFEVKWEKVGHGKSKLYVSSGPETRFRLPLEIEWEYVAKQPLKARQRTDQIIRKVDEGSTNKWGISHLIDNVSEWVIMPDDTLAIARGGSWSSKINYSDRHRMDPDSSNGYTGFRIVRTYTPIEINKKPDK